MSKPSVTREECEAILAKESWLICNKCGWHGPYAEDHSRSGPTSCPYDPIETAHFEKRLARAYLALLDSSEQTIQAAEKLAECLEKLKLFRTSQYHVMWSEVDVALAQYAARRGTGGEGWIEGNS